jgi:hypothetical protein
MTMILNWLAGRIAGPAATLCALLLGGGLAWQTGRIDGWPLIGGGLKEDIAELQLNIAARGGKRRAGGARCVGRCRE